MGTLVSISTKPDPDSIRNHWIQSLPVLVIYPHNQCNCRCVMCDIWRIREAKEISPQDLEQLLPSFRELGVRWVVLSGGEPQLNEKWSWLARMLRAAGSRRSGGRWWCGTCPPAASGCCSPVSQSAEETRGFERLAEMLSMYNVNDYAASVRVYAIKPTE